MEQVVPDKNKNKVVCEYYDEGYCMYKEKCKNLHHKEVCQESFCNRKECFRRHPKACRYKEHCRRGRNCLYLHVVDKYPMEGEINTYLQKTIEDLKKVITALIKADDEKEK